MWLPEHTPVLHNVVQALCFLGSAAAIWMLTSMHTRIRRWGCWVGLSVQPAWFLAALWADQWGILLVDVWFTIAYIRGIRNNA